MKRLPEPASAAGVIHMSMGQHQFSDRAGVPSGLPNRRNDRIKRLLAGPDRVQHDQSLRRAQDETVCLFLRNNQKIVKNPCVRKEGHILHIPKGLCCDLWPVISHTDNIPFYSIKKCYR